MQAPSAGSRTASAILRRASVARFLPLAIALAGVPVDAATVVSRSASLGPEQFKHTRWTSDDGAPTGIYDIAQTPDGYLWLATEDGLFRFDGVTFERIPPPPGSRMEQTAAFSLLVRRSGELWVAFAQSGGIAAYRHGRLVDLHMPDPPPSIDSMVETADGAVWIAWGGLLNSDKRLQRVSGGRFEPVADRLQLPGGMISAMALTPNGTLWIALHDGVRGTLVSLARGDDRFRQTGFAAPGQFGVAVDPKGVLWKSDASGLSPLVRDDGKIHAPDRPIPAIPGAAFGDLAFDAKGGVWGATGTLGVYHQRSGGVAPMGGADALQRFRAADGLTADRATTIFVDLEDNVWIGTDKGLDQFRAADVRHEPLIRQDPSQPAMMARSNDGSVYVLSSAALYVIAPGQAPRALGPPAMGAICTARAGGIWTIYDRRAVRIDGDRRTAAVAIPPGTEPAATCAEGRDGLLLRLASMRLLRHDGRGWITLTTPDDALRTHTHWDLEALPSGDIAFERDTGIVRLGGGTESAVALKAFDLAPLTTVASAGRDILVGANRGLFRIRDGQVRVLSGSRHGWLHRLRGLVRSPAGHTWLLSKEGISRVATADLDRAFDDPARPLPRRLFDERDGLSGGLGAWGVGGPQAVVGGDGRVWFLSGDGVISIDPAVHVNRIAPRMAIRSLSAGGAVFRDPAAITLPAGTRSLEIVYAALSLAVPQRVRFRYRLEGVDDGWVDPGARRTASYSNLGPGRYRFQVIASNNDGVWNRTGATLDFAIRPTFVQSWPFRLLCGLLLLGLLWLAYSLRLRAVADRIRMRMAERMAERERIARDLHDTLLQSVQALTLRFQLVVDELPIKATARPALEAAIDRADQVIAEGRDRVKELRSPQAGGDIEQIISEIVAQQRFDPAIAVSIETVGTPRAPDPMALDEIARIAGEAIFNILRHARATRIAIEIRHHASFAISFVDNGVGIDPAILEHGGRDGHFGLPGMRERARKLDGDLIVRRIAAGGTQVMLTVPGRIAYASRSPWRFWRRRPA